MKLKNALIVSMALLGPGGIGCYAENLKTVNTQNIPAMYQQVAKVQGVPMKLFYALILTESQTRLAAKQTIKTINTAKRLPWPWTVNHRGQAYYFQDKQSAFQFSTRLVSQGDVHFDVGLGQINWRWHYQRFASLWSAFDPHTNLTVAAQFLREQYQRPECRPWPVAAGCYHRPAQGKLDKALAMRYAEKVQRHWQQ